MRLLHFMLVMMMVLAFTGCNPAASAVLQNPLAAQQNNFEVNAAITFGKLSATAIIKRENPQACSVSFMSPSSLEGLSFMFEAERIDLSYKSLILSVNPNSMPGGAIAVATVGALNAAMSDRDISVSSAGNALTLSGSLYNEGFVLALDEKSCEILRLDIPGQELSVDFSGFTLIS